MSAGDKLDVRAAAKRLDKRCPGRSADHELHRDIAANLLLLRQRQLRSDGHHAAAAGPDRVGQDDVIGAADAVQADATAALKARTLQTRRSSADGVLQLTVGEPARWPGGENCRMSGPAAGVCSEEIVEIHGVRIASAAARPAASPIAQQVPTTRADA